MRSDTDSKTVSAPYVNNPPIRRDSKGIWHVHGYGEARDLLKQELIQEGFSASELRKAGFEGVLYMHGEPHRQMRSAIAKYFSPTTVQQTHMPMIEQTANELIAELKQKKRLNLKKLSNRMAVVVASAIVGLNPTKGMNRRIDKMLHAPKISENPILREYRNFRGLILRLAFLLADVMPAISARRRSPQDDVISYMLSKGKGAVAIWVECIIYAAAGITTTQEFICIVLLHCMKNPAVREVMISGNREMRYEALHEILRLEPVIANLYRSTDAPITLLSEGKDVTIPAHEQIAFHVYDSNVDSRWTGADPTRLHPHREMEKGAYRSMLGFGSGVHRCAGEHLAIAETDVFIQKLLQIPSLRIESGPDIICNDTVESYEVNNMIVGID